MQTINDKKFRAVLAGATGLVGKQCLNLLLNHPAYEKVTVLTRREVAVQHPGLRQKIIDFENLKDGLNGVSGDHLFCCLGTTMKKAGSRERFKDVDFKYPLQLAEYASQEQYSQFLVISSLGANPNSPFFYNRVKGELEVALQKVPIKGIQVLRPSLLTGDRSEFRTGERLMSAVFKMLNPILAGRLKKYRSISASTVARAMVGLAVSELTGFNVFESDLIQFFADRIGEVR